MQLDDVTADHAGVLSRAQIIAAGGTDLEIRRAIERGAIRRLRPGWYAWATADPAVAQAVAAGGVASCITALASLGVWVPSDRRVHARRSRRLRGRKPRGVTVCDLPHGRRHATPSSRDSALVALEAAAGCLSQEWLTVVIDSALRLELVTWEELRRLWQHASREVRQALADADQRAESGTESLVRIRLRRHGIALRPQAWIGRKRVDLLIGDSLIIEVDSQAWHLDVEAYTRDRERDRQLAALGYQVIRLTYHQVLDDWASVEADILAMIGRGAHRRAVAPTG